MARPVSSPFSIALLSIVIALTEVRAQTPTPPPPWTFLIYAACDNDAENDGNFFRFLDRVRGAFAEDGTLEIVLFIDRSKKYSTNATSLGEDFADARLYRVRRERCERLAGGEQFPEITLDGSYEADSADPINVRKFLAFGKARFPARHYALMLYGHADGRAMCPDEQSRSEMGFAQLTEAVPEELSVDLMALELCNMGGLEIAYQWRPGKGRFSTRWLVAIPNAGPALDWDRVFAKTRDAAALTPEALGTLVVEEGGRGRRAEAVANPGRARSLGYEAVACYDLAKTGAAKATIDALAVALAASDSKATVEAVRGVDDDFTLNYSRDRLEQGPYVDAFDLTTRLAACPKLSEPVRTSAAAAAAAIDAVVVSSYGGDALPRFTPGSTGIYLTFPPGDEVLGRDGQPEPLWSLCRW